MPDLGAEPELEPPEVQQLPEAAPEPHHLDHDTSFATKESSLNYIWSVVVVTSSEA